MSQFVTPFVGADGQRRIRFWEQHERGPAFVRVITGGEEVRCPNCADYGVVLISFCKYGPTEMPLSQKKPSTYFSGNQRFGKGWYMIEQSLGLECPTCSDAGLPELAPRGGQ